LRKIAIDALSPIEMDPVNRVCLAKELKVPSWLLSGYQDLAERSTTLSEDEAAQIGLSTALKLSKVTINRLRDQLASKDLLDIGDHIRDMFRGEFDAIEAAASSYPTTRERQELEAEKAMKLAEQKKKEAAEREERARQLKAKEAAEQEKQRRDAAEKARLKSERECQLRKLTQEEERVRKELETLEIVEQTTPVVSTAQGGWPTSLYLAQGQGTPTPKAGSSKAKKKASKKGGSAESEQIGSTRKIAEPLAEVPEKADTGVQ
jgi:hypothetical protein